MSTIRKNASKILIALIVALAIFGGSSFSAFRPAVQAAEKAGIYYPDFNSIEEAHEYGTEMIPKIMEEAVVLMKNNDDTLPFAKGTGISIVGNQSHKMIAGGSGSGGSAGIVVGLPEALDNVGMKVNGKLEAFYAAHRLPTVNMPLGMFGGTTATVVEEDPAMLSTFDSSYNFYGNALFTISRGGGEGSDLPLTSSGNAMKQVNADESKHYMQLFDNEIKMIQYLKDLKKAGLVKKIVILMNVVAAFEMAPLQDDDDIDAILWIGQPSTHGLQGVANVLAGIASPSGRTVDIWDANHKADPTWFNFGSNEQHGVANNRAYSDEETVAGNEHFMVEYEEGIYLGYKWYETAAADNVLTKLSTYNKDAYDPSSASDNAYYNRSNGIIYPFGYGLSYTEFKQEILMTGDEIAAKINAASGLDDIVTVPVKVTNVGDRAGKEVVQLYVNAPYTKGGIEKAEVALIGFDKTETLKAGQSEVVEVSFRLAEIASFDYNDANKNNYKGWEIEAGDYEIRLQKNSHEVIKSVTATLTAKTTSLDNDSDAANNTPFSEGDEFDTRHDYDGNTPTKIMSRADFVGTFPQAPTIEERIFSEAQLLLMVRDDSIAAGDHEGENTRYHGYTNSSDDKETDPWYKSEVPSGWTQGAGTLTDGKYAIQMKDMSGIDYESDVILTDKDTSVAEFVGKTGREAWEIFMNQLTWDELKSLLQRGQYQTPGLASVGKAQATDQDGPAQLKGGISMPASTVVAATWNVDIAYLYGRIIGNDSLFLGEAGWYAPAMNIHRSPFAGRNFEYYSQDTLLSGLIAAANCKGFQDMGGYVFLKHFAINDQETDRIGVNTYLDEQNMRENYLKTFELSVKEGHAQAAMTSFNHVGSINSFGNYHLITTVLRNEWGFRGEIVTDYYMQPASKFSMILRAGGNLLLGTASGQNAVGGTWDATLRNGKGGVREGNAVEGVVPESATQYYAVRSRAMEILWVGANSNNNRNGLDMTAFAAKTFNFKINMGASDTVAVDAAALGTDQVKYTITSGTLPAGLTLNPNTGAISGTPTQLASNVRVGVRLTADGWISANANMTFNVEPNFKVKAGEAFEEAVTVYKVGDTVLIQGQNRTLNGANAPNFTSLPEGVTYNDGKISGTIAEPGNYTVSFTQRVTYPGNSGNSNANISANLILQVTDAQGNVPSSGSQGDAPTAEKPVVIRVNNGQIQYATYANGAASGWTNLIAVSSLTGATGATGRNGLDGLDGQAGVRGVGVESITSVKNGNVTTVTVTLTNGEVSSFDIADGEKGETGATGEQGAAGKDGANGKDGAAGKDGANGKDGKGCSGAIGLGAGIASIIALLGAAVVVRKKED